MGLRNRREQVTSDPRTAGRECLWEYRSFLTVARTFPRVGGRLLAHALRTWPIAFREEIAPHVRPDVSVVVGIRGTARLPQFQACLASLRGQTGCGVEVIVVEQSARPELDRLDFRGARYVHSRPPAADMPYNRSWALNVGVRHSRGRALVLTDADMLLPAGFSAAVLSRLDAGLDGLRPVRFLFYLDSSTSASVQTDRRLDGVTGCEDVSANVNNPLALTRAAYDRLGGHDESFVDWGAEDTEFLQRASTLDFSHAGFLPAVHLWHPTAANAIAGDRNEPHLARVATTSAAERAARLRKLSWGGEVPLKIRHPLDEGQR